MYPRGWDKGYSYSFQPWKGHSQGNLVNCFNGFCCRRRKFERMFYRCRRSLKRVKRSEISWKVQRVSAFWSLVVETKSSQIHLSIWRCKVLIKDYLMGGKWPKSLTRQAISETEKQSAKFLTKNAKSNSIYSKYLHWDIIKYFEEKLLCILFSSDMFFSLCFVVIFLFLFYFSLFINWGKCIIEISQKKNIGASVIIFCQQEKRNKKTANVWWWRHQERLLNAFRHSLMKLNGVFAEFIRHSLLCF